MTLCWLIRAKGQEWNGREGGEREEEAREKNEEIYHNTQVLRRDSIIESKRAIGKRRSENTPF